jgi:hypothetical protein
LAMSPATDGFSVIMRDLDMGAGIEPTYRTFASAVVSKP